MEEAGREGLGGPSTGSKNDRCCSFSVFTTIPDTQKRKTIWKDHTEDKVGREGEEYERRKREKVERGGLEEVGREGERRNETKKQEKGKGTFTPN